MFKPLPPLKQTPARTFTGDFEAQDERLQQLGEPSGWKLADSFRVFLLSAQRHF
jgi:hypothetical protein